MEQIPAPVLHTRYFGDARDAFGTLELNGVWGLDTVGLNRTNMHEIKKISEKYSL
jgi:hypothetical protein